MERKKYNFNKFEFLIYFSECRLILSMHANESFVPFAFSVGSSVAHTVILAQKMVKTRNLSGKNTFWSSLIARTKVDFFLFPTSSF